MLKANVKIRDALKNKGIYQWQLAEKLNISEFTLTRYLRKELSKEQQAEMLKTIEKMAKEENK